jgi:hypothetical protein
MTARMSTAVAAAAPAWPWAGVWRAIWQQRRNQGGLPWSIVLPVLLLVAALILWPRVPHAVVWTLVCVLGGALLLGAWWLALMALAMQNHPTAARLVPAQVTQLRLAFLIGWAGVSAIVGLAAACSIGQPLRAVAGAAAVQLVVALIVRWPAAGVLVWLLSSTVRLWLPPSLARGIGRALRDHVLDRPVVLLALAVAMALVGMRVLIQAGGAAHQGNYQRRARWVEAMNLRGRGNLSARVTWLPGGANAIFTWPYRSWFRFLLARPSASPMARAWLVLGPGGHWTNQCLAALYLLVVFGVLALIYLPQLRSAHVPAAGLVGPGIGVLMTALSPVFQAPVFEQTRREQALLMLAPGMPRGRALNRAIALRQGVQLALAWTLATVLLVTLAGYFRSDVRFGLAIALGGLPVVPVAWRDWARMKPVTPGTQVAWMLMMVASLGTCVGAYLLHVPLWVIAPGVAAVTLAAGRWRWRRATHAPVAWPTGRLG